MQTDVIAPQHHTRSAVHAQRAHSRWEARVAIATVLVFGIALSAVLLFALESKATLGTSITRATIAPHTGPPNFPVGNVELLEPSGMGPPLPSSLPGYRRVYTQDFSGTRLPPGWTAFTGVPGGDPEAHFVVRNVRVGGGMLRLVTTPAGYRHWHAGGLCQCARPMRFGAFFVRSRITGAGPNEVELLWPANNQWPPEIDFNESGSRWAATSGTVHFGPPTAEHFIQQNYYPIDLKRWHTWGVVWTPTSVTYTVDGYQWGTTLRTPGTIPQLPMTLDLQQRPQCPPGAGCPNQNQSMLVDWVAEFVRA